MTPSFLLTGDFELAARGDVGRLETLRSLDNIELDLRTLGEAAEARALDRREVHKNVLATFHGDEAETLCIVKPFDSTVATHC